MQYTRGMCGTCPLCPYHQTLKSQNCQLSLFGMRSEQNLTFQTFKIDKICNLFIYTPYPFPL